MADLGELDVSDDDFQHLEDVDSPGEGSAGDDDSGRDDLDYLKYDNVGAISKLQESQWYTDVMRKIDGALQKGSASPGKGIIFG